VRQPEVARASVLLLALVLAVPVLGGITRLVIATAFLLEFSDDRWPALTALTSAPLERPRPLGDHAADGFTPRTLRPPTPLVLVHGVTGDGKDDPRARRAARLLARTGYDVTLPTIPGLVRARLRPDDVEPVIAALAPSRHPAVIVAVSVGGGPALFAATDPRARDRVAMVVVLGGYASATELVRFYLTGEYRHGPVAGHRVHDPDLVRTFLRANADLVDDATGALPWGAVDAVTADRVLAATPSRVRALLDRLSPGRIVRGLRAPLILVHGRDDPVVPFTESLALAAAAPRDLTTLVVVDVLGHVGANDGGPDWSAVARLWAVAYRLVSAA
jgi:pimeloyl-ACP methyl ester carboxylesterase